MAVKIPPSTKPFESWLSERGGGFHRHVTIVERFCGDFIQIASNCAKDRTNGASAVAAEELSPNTIIVSCPFSLVITKTVAQTALSNFLDVQTIIAQEKWSERQWISSYLCFHWIIRRESNESVNLFHYEYVDTLPQPNQLLTPLHFTSSEFEVFIGTNLHGATLDRQCQWQEEHTACLETVSKANTEWATLFTWDRYLAGATYLSSRAFPSSLLRPNPTLVADSSTEPVLIPGLDSLNHARGAGVTWAVTYPDSNSSNMLQKEPLVSLMLHNSAKANQEIFNNYGPKPNSELILGYGFSLPKNPDDTIILKVAGLNGQRWSVGRGAQGVEGLWNELLQSFAPERGVEPSIEDQLDAASALAEMCQALLDRLPDPDTNKQDGLTMRTEVLDMLSDYVEGQRDILESINQFSRQKEEEGISAARDKGIEIVFDQ